MILSHIITAIWILGLAWITGALIWNFRRAQQLNLVGHAYIYFRARRDDLSAASLAYLLASKAGHDMYHLLNPLNWYRSWELPLQINITVDEFKREMRLP